MPFSKIITKGKELIESNKHLYCTTLTRQEMMFIKKQIKSHKDDLIEDMLKNTKDKEKMLKGLEVFNNINNLEIKVEGIDITSLQNDYFISLKEEETKLILQYLERERTECKKNLRASNNDEEIEMLCDTVSLLNKTIKDLEIELGLIVTWRDSQEDEE